MAKALTTLRVAGVQGPYALLLPAERFTAASETVDHGYPVYEHVKRQLAESGKIVVAPSIHGAIVVTLRGGDYSLTLGEDVAIG